ncbi:hypothetical protein LTR36_000892 [Oleoguttula mirabilis]|uniref:Uncharacterized protein n=1 Tax=Oleoguttula mirabilis TaxID=1507867 RepID=A0AAV9J300_9PEZI|nr:hypothetical protein LTR36_000892 [Oleoguttula mirabilis]
MGHPGWVLHPNGRKVLAADKWAYMQQHPGTYASTDADARALYVDTNCSEVQEEAHELWKREQKEMHAAQVAKGKSFGHYCVGGKVPRDCGECRASFAG